jgi:predicted nucleic acid-binding protein
VTSALVAAEGHGWFLRRYDPHRAVQFLAFLDALPALRIVPFDPPAIAEASLMVKSSTDQKLTLADAHGVAIMRKLRIPCCWSTDRHLALGGATLVI